MISVMVVAMITVHRVNPFFVATNGIEHPLMFAIAALAVALTGPGRYSLDYALGLLRWETPGITWVVLAIGVIGGLLQLAVRKPVTKTA
jgi:putative oxidoreductase